MKTKNVIFILFLLSIFLIASCQKEVIGIPQNTKGIHVGDIIKIGGRELTLIDVGSNGNIVVSVSGVQSLIEKNSAKTINCIPISNEGFYFTGKTKNRMAFINVGDDRSKCR